MACEAIDHLDGVASRVAQSLLADQSSSEAAGVTRAVGVAEAASQTLSQDQVKAKVSACATLAEDALSGEVQASAELAKMLCDGSSEVRKAAMEALISIADCAPQGVIDLASEQLELTDMGLRWRSHEHSIVSAAFLGRSVSSTAVGAAEGAARASSGEQDAAQAVKAKVSTCTTLAEDALSGEVQASAELAKLLCDGTSEVRTAAMEALISIADGAPQGVIDLASEQLELADMGLRWRSHEHSIVSAAFLARSFS